MAATLSPEIVIDSVTNAVISWDGKLVSQGIIYWHIPAVAATELTANYKNYVSSWNPNYGWDSFENGKSTFDGSSNTCHISAMVTGYKYTITTSSNISEYNNVVYDTREKAEAEVVKIKNTLVNGNYGYTVIVQGSGVTYEIYKVDLIRVPEEGGPQNIGQCNATKDFDVSNYITVQEKPELPDFNCSVTASTNSASAYVSGIKPSDKVSFTINGTTKSINASNGGDALLTIDGLAEGTKYNWSVSVEGYKGPKTDTVVTLTTSFPTITIQSYSYTTATAVINNLKSGDEIDYTVYLQNSNEVVKSTTTLYAQGSSVSIPISGLTEDTGYRVPAVINNQTTNVINANFKTLKSNVSYSKNKGTNSMEVKVSGLGNGITATYWFKEEDGDAPELISPSGATSYTWTNNNLKYNTTYTHSLRINYPDGGYKFLFLSETFSFTLPSEPEPGYRIENITDTSAEIKVINLKTNDNIKIVLSKGSEEIETKNATAQSGVSTMGFIFKELQPNTSYTVSIEINTTSFTDGFTTTGSSGTDISYALTDITYDGLTVNISNAPANVEVEVKIQYNGTISFYGTTNNNGNASITVSGLGVGLPYKAWIYVSESLINSGGDDFYTLFKWWISNPVKGNTMGMYNNSPAPVKAEEWNRLVALINSKLNMNINTVTAGDEMNAGSGGNVKVVASALGVGVASKDEVTASFFDALKTAINNIKG